MITIRGASVVSQPAGAPYPDAGAAASDARDGDITTAYRTKLFINYALNTYKVDASRIYVTGYSAGSSLTWDYVNNFPGQIAAVVPMSGSWGTASGCTLKETPAWAFQAADDPVGLPSDPELS